MSDAFFLSLFTSLSPKNRIPV